MTAKALDWVRTSEAVRKIIVRKDNRFEAFNVNEIAEMLEAYTADLRKELEQAHELLERATS